MRSAHVGEQVFVLLDPTHNNSTDTATAFVSAVWGHPHEYHGHKVQTVNVRVLADSADTPWLTSIRLYDEHPRPEHLAAANPANPKGYRAVAFRREVLS